MPFEVEIVPHIAAQNEQLEFLADLVIKVEAIDKSNGVRGTLELRCALDRTAIADLSHQLLQIIEGQE